ncbi:MAG: hypothetical protein H7257_05715 [Taibaiella sp.]|nr:hypothetical protein [Taibaiella sp.]
MKGSLKSILALIAGIILISLSMMDMLKEEDESIINIGGSDNTGFFYLVIGLVLLIAGIMGLSKEAKKPKRRKY